MINSGHNDGNITENLLHGGGGGGGKDIANGPPVQHPN